MKTKKFAVAGVSLLLSLTTGCSLLMPSYQILTVQVTEPPHTGVWVNNKYEGEAPVQVSLLRNHSADVVAKKEGFQTSEKLVGCHINVWGGLDIAGTWLFLLPLVGVISPGSHSLDDTTLVMHLAPEETPVSPTNVPAAVTPTNAPPTVTSTNTPVEAGATNASPGPTP
jgi:hypothetical protein